MSDSIVTGKVHVIEETKSYGQNGFRKRLVVLEQDKGRFTNYIPVEFTHEGCDSLDDVSIGSEIEIAYRLNGRKWQRDPQSEVKFFLNAEGLSFTLLSNDNSSADAPFGQAPTSQAPTSQAPLANAPNQDFQMDDDIPF
jgi:hypothetical protein